MLHLGQAQVLGALQRAIVLGRPEGWRPRPGASPGPHGHGHGGDGDGGGDDPDRREWVEGTFRFDSYEDAVSELLALGVEVEVLLPIELREAMAEVGRAITARHDGAPGPSAGSPAVLS